jgi:hypothetical protein
MTFEIALDIIPHFSQDETSGGQGKIKAWSRGPMVTDPVTGHRAMGARVQLPDIVGNTAPVSSADIRTDNTGKIREGDIWIFTLKRLQVADQVGEATSVIVERNGYYYTLDVGNDWHYARGNRYVAYLDRGEGGS